MSYAVCCKSCGNVESNAYYGPNDERAGQPMRDANGKPVPLTPQGQVPIYCQKCGSRTWRVPATAEDIAKFAAAVQRQERAIALCRELNLEGLLKIPDEVHATAEVKNALSNLLAPLEGDVLKTAQTNCIRVARSGISVAAEMWVELYEKAIAKAKDVKAKAA